ncbi:hypothetical protein ScPMuIL_008804 [Solemya velum]
MEIAGSCTPDEHDWTPIHGAEMDTAWKEKMWETEGYLETDNRGRDFGDREDLEMESLGTLVLRTCLVCLIVVLEWFMAVRSSLWHEWWTYDGISGPTYWGVMNRAWSLCSRGRFQSPIDIHPNSLLFDPMLTSIMFPSHKANGNLTNTGHDVTLFIDHDISILMNATAGPLQYQFAISQIKIHYGRQDEKGSEHTINGTHFSAEVHIMAYNKELYENFTRAAISPGGIAIFAVLCQIGKPGNQAFSKITEQLSKIRLKGDAVRLEGLPITTLLPNTHQYMTYEGSFTQPGCQETVTWVVFNKPIYIQKQELILFRKIHQVPEDNTDMVLETNIRPTMPLHNRVVRTNINFRTQSSTCTMRRRGVYEVNKPFRMGI